MGPPPSFLWECGCHHKLASLTSTTTQQQQPKFVGTGEEKESLRVANFQAQHGKEDPTKRPAESFPSLQGLGEAPALSQDAVSSSSFGLGRAPALEENSDKNSASISASSLEEHMSSRHRFSKQLAPVVTQLSIAVTSLQDCIRTLVELQSDSFYQQDATAELRASSLGNFNSSRANNNSNKTQEKRNSLELTPRTCKSKSEETGSHPELEPEELEQIEAKQEEKQEAEAAQLAAQQHGPAEQQQQQPPAYKRTREHTQQKQLPKNKRWCMICWKRGHTTETCWYNDQWQNQQHETAWTTPSTMQQQPARASEKELEHRPYNYSLTLVCVNQY